MDEAEYQAQLSTVSFAGRSLRQFDDLSRALLGIDAPRILSYGCSRGFEPVDLQLAVPGAQVFGCDVNEAALQAARELCEPLGITTFPSTTAELARHGPFDAITAMNVLCRHPVSDEELLATYPFARFAEDIARLVDLLVPGGFLVVDNASYPVERTAAAAQLEPVVTAHRQNGWLEKHDEQGRRLKAEVLYRDRWMSRAEAGRVMRAEQAAGGTPLHHTGHELDQQRLAEPELGPVDLRTFLWRRRRAPARAAVAPQPMFGIAQSSLTTYQGRHDLHFGHLARLLEPVQRPRILSFGCSTGAEPLDLLRSAPGAVVSGCDVNRRALAAAREVCEPHGIDIFDGSPEALAMRAPFDAIVAMNVLCRFPPPVVDDLSAAFAFEQFELTLGALVGALRPGGLLMVYNAQYLVEQAACAARLEPVPTGLTGNGWLEKYGRDGRRLTAVTGVWKGDRLALRDWRAAIVRDTPGLVEDTLTMADAAALEVLEYEHRPLHPPLDADLATVVWRKPAGCRTRTPDRVSPLPAIRP